MGYKNTNSIGVRYIIFWPVKINLFLILLQDIISGLNNLRPNSHGLTILPFLSGISFKSAYNLFNYTLQFIIGERAPGWCENATCTISGITSSTTPLDILQASLEAVALRLYAIFTLLGTKLYSKKHFIYLIFMYFAGSHVASNAVVVASGTGLTSSRSWRQIIGIHIAFPTSI